jgi:hypothetical protein
MELEVVEKRKQKDHFLLDLVYSYCFDNEELDRISCPSCFTVLEGNDDGDQCLR